MKIIPFSIFRSKDKYIRYSYSRRIHTLRIYLYNKDVIELKKDDIEKENSIKDAWREFYEWFLLSKEEFFILPTKDNETMLKRSDIQRFNASVKIEVV